MERVCVRQVGAFVWLFAQGWNWKCCYAKRSQFQAVAVLRTTYYYRYSIIALLGVMRGG